MKKKKTNFCVLVGTIIIVLLLVLIALIGFRSEGFASKVLFTKTSQSDLQDGSCYYKDQLGKRKLTLDCQHNSSKGYFCESTVSLKNLSFSLSKNTCENLNTCFDGIKNQDELGIDCGGVCAPCDALYCTQNSDCQTGNSCSSGYCDLETNQCVMSLQPNGTVCGSDMVCQFGDCTQIFNQTYTPNDIDCKLNYVVSNPLLDIPRCSDPIREGFEFSRTYIGEQLILPWQGSETTQETKVLINGQPLSEGSIIGVFREDATGIEVNEGFVYWLDDLEDQKILFVSGFTPLLPTYGGMEQGEEFIWKVWDIDSNQIYYMTPSYYTLEELGLSYGYSQNNFYSPDSLTVLKKLENISGCQTNSNCDDGNPCTVNVCANGVCETTNIQNGTSCGSGGLICQNGSCITAECTSNPDCDDGNPCTNNTCSNFLCSTVPFPNNTSCGNGMVCQAGNCIAEPECTINSDCEDNNPCTNNLCTNGECLNPVLPDNTSCGNGMVCQAGSCVQEPECTINSDCESGEICQNGECVLESSDLCVINTNCENQGECKEGFCNNTLNYFPYSNMNVPTQLFDIIKVNNNWYGFSLGKIHKLDSSFNLIASYQLEDSYSYMYFKENKWYFSKPTDNKIYVYDSSFNLLYDFQLTIPNVNVIYTYDLINVNNVWYVGISNDSFATFNENWEFIELFNSNYNMGYLTNKDNHIYITYNRTSGNAIKKFTLNFEFIEDYDLEEFKDLMNRSSVHKFGLFYDNGWYISLLQEVYKFDDQFNIDSFCSFDVTSLNGAECSLGYCDNGECEFSSILAGLCNQAPVNTGTPLGMILMESARELNDNEVVLGLSGKYIDDEGNLKCGGVRDWDYPTFPNVIVTMFGNDSTTPEKDGFYGGEYINLYIRTTNYLCNVNGIFHVELGWISNQKWYPISLAKLLQFKDFTTGSTTIDFSNTDNCTYLGPVQ